MASLYSLLHDSQYDWRIKLEDKNDGLVKSAHDFSPNLFLFDSFQEKPVEENASDQLVYSYTIINLYDLFFDSGKYIKDIDSPFLTDIASADAQYINFFYDSLQELRSIICHNKPKDSIRYKKFHRQLGWNKIEWGCFDYLRRSGYCFSYEDSFKLLTQSAVKVLDILKKCLDDNRDEPKKDRFEKKWYDHIIEWYKRNMTVHIRAVQTYFNMDPKDFKKRYNSKYGKLEDDAKYVDKVVEILKEKWLSEEFDWDILYKRHFCSNAEDPMSLSPMNAMRTLLDQKL
ncbi:MAG: hypothetical protein IKQ16_06765 [Lentisphaeria bacterium]|nr:hypothetical protein [Lentisphaeria bacterium]